MLMNNGYPNFNYGQQQFNQNQVSNQGQYYNYQNSQHGMNILANQSYNNMAAAQMVNNQLSSIIYNVNQMNLLVNMNKPQMNFNRQNNQTMVLPAGSQRNNVNHYSSQNQNLNQNNAINGYYHQNRNQYQQQPQRFNHQQNGHYNNNNNQQCNNNHNNRYQHQQQNMHSQNGRKNYVHCSPQRQAQKQSANNQQNRSPSSSSSSSSISSSSPSSTFSGHASPRSSSASPGPAWLSTTPISLSSNGFDNEQTQKLKSALKWIIYNNQIDDYADMLCTSDDLKIFVINQCAKHSDSQSACVRWSKKWNLTNNPQCSQSVNFSMSQSKKNEIDRRNRQNRGEKDLIPGFDDVNLAAISNVDNIIYVDDKPSFDIAAKVLKAEKKCIGLDMECLVKQFSMKPKRRTCQILQIATNSKVVLFDLEAVPAKYDKKIKETKNGTAPIVSKEFDDLIHGMFYDSSILKIGMSFFGDIKLLRTEYPYLNCFKCIIKNYFELTNVLNFVRSKKGRRVFDINMETESSIKRRFSKSNMKKEGGLATIARHVTKQRLSKKEQLSNWALRPLRLSQIKYAALDAQIEIDIYKVLEQQHPNLIRANKWLSDLTRF